MGNERRRVLLLDVNKLKAAIVAKGLRQKDVAAALGITDRNFRYKLSKKKFYNTEIEVLIDVLNIESPMEIFFAKDVS